MLVMLNNGASGAAQGGGMSAFEIESGEIVHCVELSSGGNLTGTFSFDQDGIRAQIYSYEKFFFIRPEEPIFLLTEKNLIVSLHSNIAAPAGSNSRMSEPARTIYRQDITSSIAVIGYDKWGTADRVKRVHFTVKHTKEILRHQAKTEALAKNKFPEEHNLSIYSEPVSGMTVRAGYNASYSIELDAPIDIWPRFELEFEEEVTLYNYLDHVSCYVAFLSFSLGVHLKPSEIRISRHSQDEMMAKIEERSYPGDHTVNYVWPEVEVDTRDLWAGGSPVSAWDDDELSALRQCVVSWMERHTEWHNAYVLMMTSLTLKREISAHRLIEACKWFEEIPLTKSQNTITEEHIDAIASAAADRAGKLGYEAAIKSRIAGSLKTIRKESHEDRFSRLVKLVRHKFGQSILPEGVVAHLRHAIRLRGKTAHGHFYPADEAEFRAFSKSVGAMEAICYLLTALELPIHEDGLKRVQRNPVVRDYLRAYE